MSDAGLMIILVSLLVLFIYLYLRERSRFGKLLFDKQSLSVKYGKMSEQFFPFMKNFPYDPQNFRFMGTPVDGVQFEDDKIVFMEFKSGNSRLSEKQRKLRELVERKKVEFREIRMD